MHGCALRRVKDSISTFESVRQVFCRKVATPISKLFTEQSRIKEIVSSSGCLEGRDFSLDWEIPYDLFHCDIQPIHKLKTSDWKHLEKILSQQSKVKIFQEANFYRASHFQVIKQALL
mgnify:CR=1 FL=1